MADLLTRAFDAQTAAAKNETELVSTELPTLRSEGERLKLEVENAQLRAQLAALAKPWWSKGAVVTTLTAIIAAVVPVTTAVQAHYEKARELALQDGKQAHEIRTSYLDRLDKPGARLRTLRFVLATTNDPSLIAWAQAETKEVQAEIDGIEKRIAKLDEEIAKLDDQRAGSSAAYRSTKTAKRELLREETFIRAPPPSSTNEPPPGTAPETAPLVASSAVTKLSGEIPTLRVGDGGNDASAEVIAQLCIDEQGRVTSVKVIKSLPEIADELLRALMAWRYKPYVNAQAQPSPACFAVRMHMQVRHS